MGDRVEGRTKRGFLAGIDGPPLAGKIDREVPR
jgi:hypothetical protein